MLKIGITGGIGSGKTTVCKVFEVLDIPVYYSDGAARLLMNTDMVLISQIKSEFGDAAYQSGELDRKYLAGIVFNDALKLDRLNQLVHPAVFGDFEAWCAAQASPYVVKEAALLFESGSSKLCDRSILVTAPYELKVKRIMRRDGLGETEIISRMKRQNTDEMNRRLADYFISNDEHSLIIPQVLALHDLFAAAVVKI